MALMTRVSGTLMTARDPRFFREETRKWYVRIEKATAGGDITVKVYDSQANATSGTADYAASGTATLTTATDYTVTLANNGSVAPTFTGATVGVRLTATTDTGNEVWKADLGKRIERTLLQVLRAAKAVTVANGYFVTISTVERGLRQWEDTTGLRPYFGAAIRSLFSEPGELGRGPSANNSELTIQCVAHIDPGASDGSDDISEFFFQDLRRAILAAHTTAYDGGVSDLPIADSMAVTIADDDLDLLFARARGSLEFQVRATIDESEAEVTTA